MLPVRSGCAVCSVRRAIGSLERTLIGTRIETLKRRGAPRAKFASRTNRTDSS